MPSACRRSRTRLRAATSSSTCASVGRTSWSSGGTRCSARAVAAGRALLMIASRHRPLLDSNRWHADGRLSSEPTRRAEAAARTLWDFDLYRRHGRPCERGAEARLRRGRARSQSLESVRLARAQTSSHRRAAMIRFGCHVASASMRVSKLSDHWHHKTVVFPALCANVD
ncbi:MAG: hypothetical protein RL701_6778 [Pseudomonadota bacterium]